MKCPRCKEKIEEDVLACSYCGEQIFTYVSANATEEYMRKKQRSETLEPLLLIISLALMLPSFFINTVSVLSIGGVAVFLAGVTLFAVSRYLKHRNSNRYTVDKTARSIVRRLAKENNETVRLVAKKALIMRTVLTMGFVALLFFSLDLLYYRYWIFPVGAILFFVYEFLFLRCETFTVLYKKVKKNPDLTITDVILEETYNEVDSPMIAKATWSCIVAVILAIGGFIYMNLESNLVVVDVENGVSISKYEPSLLHLRDPVDIPDKINGKSVVAIADDAFYSNVYMTSVSMPETVKTIGSSAFYDCRSLTEIRMSSNVTEIGDSAFAYCYSLKEIEMSAALMKMGRNIFTECSNLRSAKVPEGVTVIQKGAFRGCSTLETIEWHAGLKEIQAYAFKDCDAITEVVFPGSITEIADHLFEDCDNLKSVYVPSGVKRIGKSAFNGCKLLSDVFIPDTVSEVGQHAFDDCDSLYQILLPKDTFIGKRAFSEETTSVKRKNFTDETTDKIMQEIDEYIFEKIYVVYDKNQGKEAIFSPKNNNSITVSQTERLRERLADHMDLLVFEKPVEFKKYLQKARDEGIVDVLLVFDSQVAEEAAGKLYFVSWTFDIDDLIQSYEENPDEF